MKMHLKYTTFFTPRIYRANNPKELWNISLDNCYWRMPAVTFIQCEHFIQRPANNMGRK